MKREQRTARTAPSSVHLNMDRFRTVIAVVLLMRAVASAADDSAPPAPRVIPGPPGAAEQAAETRARATALGLVLEVRGEFGFERFVSVEYTTDRRVSANLNDGVTAAAGLSFLPLAGGRFATRATVGFKVTTLRAFNGDATFTAIPVDLVEVAYAGPLRLGAGASLLLAPRLSGTGFLESESVRFRTAPGGVLEAEWIVSPRTRTGVGLRATWTRFESGTFSRWAPATGLVVRADFDIARHARR